MQYVEVNEGGEKETLTDTFRKAETVTLGRGKKYV